MSGGAIDFMAPSESQPVVPTLPSTRYRRYSDSDIDDTEMELPALDTVIPKEFLRKLKPKERKWQEVVNGE